MSNEEIAKTQHLSRRAFGGLGIAAVAGSLVPLEQLHGQTEIPAAAEEFYRLDRVLDRAASRRVYRPGVVASAPKAVQHMLFYYDKDNGLINPYNVKADTTLQAGKKYSLKAEILNFHTSPKGDNDIWKKLEDDLQLQLAVSARNSDDDFTWVALSGIKVFLGGKKSGTDQRLQGFQTALEPTKDFTGSARIAIEDGLGRLQLQLFAQKKKSFWSQFLKIASAATDSFAFGVMPIPKLLSQGVKFTSSVLDYFQVRDRLVPILTSGQLPFRILSSVNAADFTLRPGTWVAVERDFAMAHVDGNTNLPDFKVNLPGLFFEVTDKKNTAIPVDYMVCKFDFPEVKA